MKFFIRLRKYKLFRNMIVSYFILVFGTIIILTFTLFSLFSSSTAEEISTNMKTMLSQISYTSEVVYNQINTITSQLSIDSDFINDLNYNQENLDRNNPDYVKVANFLIFLKLSKINSMYQSFSSIGVYNDVNKISVDTISTPIDSNLVGKNSGVPLFYFSRIIPENKSNFVKSQYLLTFVTNSVGLTNSKSTTSIVVNISEDYILSTINNIDKAQIANTFVINLKGVVLSHTKKDEFMKDLSDTDYVHKILSGNKIQGNFIENINNQNQMVTYVKSQKLDWYFVSVIPYDSLINNQKQLEGIILIVAASFLLLGILFSILYTEFNYNPMLALLKSISKSGDINMSSKLDEFKILSDTITKSEEEHRSAENYAYRSSRFLMNSYLTNVVKGIQNKTSAANKVLDKFENQLIGPYFCCILFKIDNFKLLKDSLSDKDMELNRFAISNISQELFQNFCVNDSIIIDEDEVVLLCQLTDKRMDDSVNQILHQVQNEIKKILEITVSASTGDVVISKSDINLSYKSSQEYLKYRFFYGYSCLIDTNIVNGHLSNNVEYPYSIEKKLIEEIRTGNKSDIAVIVDLYIETIKVIPFYRVIFYCNQIITGIANSFISSGIQEKSIYTIYEINNFELISEIKNVIIAYCNDIFNQLNEQGGQLSRQRNKIAVEKVEDYIKQNYSNPNISLESISETWKLSSGYLGKLFKTETGISFNDYLNKIRLENAKDMLANTIEPISKICEKVGLYNITYFSTLFKKTYGLTPSRYREKSINSQ